MNAFNTAALQAKIADIIVAKPGERFVTFSHDALNQLFSINNEMQLRHGREEADLTEDQKNNIVDLMSDFRAGNITGLAVDGVVHAVVGEQYDQIIEQVRTREDSKAVEVAYVTKLVVAIIEANEQFTPAR